MSITNTKTIAGINVSGSTFTGSVVNSGKITASGIAISDSTITGAIVDSGYLVWSGIRSTARAGSLGALKAISISGPTFTGGISNAGALSAGSTAISVSGVTTFTAGSSIVNRLDLRAALPN